MEKEDYKVVATEIMDVFRKHWVNHDLNNTGEALAVLSLVCESMFQTTYNSIDTPQHRKNVAKVLDKFCNDIKENYK